jgi:proline dehydrogenase
MASLAIKFAGEFNNIGIAIQAYAKDAIPFLNSIAPLCKHNSSVAIRVCKGAYHESKKKVFRKERDIFLNFRRLVSRLVNYDFFLQFATHDSSLMASSVGLAVKHGKQETDYEAGMLLGVEEEAAAKLLASGVSVRIYCAFGKPWDEFVARRVIEKPRYIKYIFKR